MRLALLALPVILLLCSDAPELSGQNPSGNIADGPKSVLVVRAVFADESLAHPHGIGGDGGALTAAVAWQMLADTASYYAEQSYGLFGIDLAASDVTPTVILPITRAEGVTWADTLAAGVVASRAAGFDPAHYDLAILAFSHLPGLPWAGLSTSPILMNGTWSTSTMRHEIGHRLGVGHTSFRVADRRDILGGGADWVKDDPYDVMGGSGWDNPSAHFTTARKHDLGWLPDERIRSVAASGRFRLLPQDGSFGLGVQALRIVDATRDEEYWIEARHQPSPAGVPSRPRKNEGVIIYRRALDAGATDGIHLLDFTPETHPDPDKQRAWDPHRDDAPLVLGQTFTHRTLDVHVTPVAKNAGWPPSMDVVVNVGPFPRNKAPVLSLSTAGPLHVAVGQPFALAATASDPNRDALAFYWDFGNAEFAMQRAAVSHSFDVQGEYVVRCIVSDMKGGTATRHVIVRVGNPDTRRISGSVRDPSGAPLENVLVYAGDHACYTDSDGRYVLTGLGTELVAVAGGSYGLDILPASQSVSAADDPTGIDFVGHLLTDGEPATQAPTISMTPKAGVPGAGAELAVVFNDPQGAATLTAATIDMSWAGGSARLFPDLFDEWPLFTGTDLFTVTTDGASGAYVLTLHPHLGHWLASLETPEVVFKATSADADGHQAVEVALYSAP